MVSGFSVSAVFQASALLSHGTETEPLKVIALVTTPSFHRWALFFMRNWVVRSGRFKELLSRTKALRTNTFFDPFPTLLWAVVRATRYVPELLKENGILLESRFPDSETRQRSPDFFPPSTFVFVSFFLAQLLALFFPNSRKAFGIFFFSQGPSC